MTHSSRGARRTRTVVLAVAGALALGSLALTSRASAPGSIDPRSYYEDYEVGQGEDGGWFGLSGGVADGAASGAAAAGSARESAGPGRMPPVPGPTQDNTFVDAGTSGAVDPADDPLSTFALDVDTGSYGVARTWLRDGRRPPPASVRVEEWVNAQTYDGPAAPASGPDAEDLSVTTETADSPTCADTQLVRVAVDAREIDPAERPRVNVTLVVDRSGSMDIRSRLGLVQSSLALLAQRLDADDTVSVVGFEDRATALLEPTPVSDTDRILDTIDELRPGGSTNLAAGLRLGYRLARQNATDDAVNAVVLASDGVANVGTTGPGSIVDRIEAEGRDGIHLVTVSYGMGNYNDHLMEQLADRGDGFYSYVDTYGEAERLFGSDLVTTLTPVASEARAQVAFDPDLVSSYRLVGYDNRAVADEDFDDLGVDAGELGAGHHATALYEVVLAEGVEPGTLIGTADVRWRSTASGEAGRADGEVRAAGADVEPSRYLLHASVAADLAETLKGVRSRGRCEVDLATLGERAADVGAQELRRLVRQAQDARAAR
ncbi:von Willebrand factor type A domain-containing protein [Nocardioides sp. CFH 31398]|uniref:vWA domain-containing protein n=1 Tax=Nocardioides sp. CFH 31398 TaxID=2919579 RepID=UPI001F058820|nr:von Willebrand factor type A domain-containing protein [Nocardioides sp. CFH 31398]MCH1865164.1 von Willebrand factor type A domain-containing protein [Nocardioides sp. CFH 31398]